MCLRFCEQCSQLVCDRCCFGDHSSHGTRDVFEVHRERRDKVMGCITQTEQHMKHITHLKSNVKLYHAIHTSSVAQLEEAGTIEEIVTSVRRIAGTRVELFNNRKITKDKNQANLRKRA